MTAISLGSDLLTLPQALDVTIDQLSDQLAVPATPGSPKPVTIDASPPVVLVGSTGLPVNPDPSLTTLIHLLEARRSLALTLQWVQPTTASQPVVAEKPPVVSLVNPAADVHTSTYA